MTNREKCQIQPNDPGIPACGLGSFVTGYDSSLDSKPIAATVIFVLLAIGMLVAGVYFAFFCGEELAVRVLLGMLFLLFAGSFLYGILRIWFRVERVYVFDNGFFWMTENKNGKVLKDEVVDFSKAVAVLNNRTRQYKNGTYTGTSYNLAVMSDNATLFKKRGSYSNQNELPDEGGWLYFSLQAILQQWMKIGVERMNEELRTKGYISFGDIAVSKDYIRKGDTTIERGDITYKFSGGILTIDSASKGKKILNVKHDISINVNGMLNGQWFLVAVKNLLGIV